MIQHVILLPPTECEWTVALHPPEEENAMFEHIWGDTLFPFPIKGRLIFSTEQRKKAEVEKRRRRRRASPVALEPCVLSLYVRGELLHGERARNHSAIVHDVLPPKSDKSRVLSVFGCDYQLERSRRVSSISQIRLPGGSPVSTRPSRVFVKYGEYVLI
ncbi:hypothetical protein BLNAU_17251 [Blattamonas nauphoetae]|uniref:Uncharacterized protein n=1 Tax=Blattamonas nauphoetae TaxID=2049346 RepID=A0ABQ9XC27_9EUKA|nr:hypothetical protein BLNAU_17251 [Blattamonas nauphoetae]